MKTLSRFLLTPVFCAALLAGENLPTLPHALQLDPSQTKVEFTVSSTLHTVHGTFALKHGSIQFDPATGKASGELVVDAASGDSGSSARDHRMNKDILQSDRYPEIVFRPDRVEGKIALTGKSQVQLHGIFSMHGGDHEILMPLEVEAGDGQFAANGHFSIPYVKWGMKNPSTLILRVDQNVELHISTVAR
jgi:polyisoprenoid-binding protein YceI